MRIFSYCSITIRCNKYQYSSYFMIGYDFLFQLSVRDVALRLRLFLLLFYWLFALHGRGEIHLVAGFQISLSCTFKETILLSKLMLVQMDYYWSDSKSFPEPSTVIHSNFQIILLVQMADRWQYFFWSYYSFLILLIVVTYLYLNYKESNFDLIFKALAHNHKLNRGFSTSTCYCPENKIIYKQRAWAYLHKYSFPILHSEYLVHPCCR
jgi:hypothetical protein